jgi:hypothetical protein
LDFTRRATLVSFHLKALELINVYIDLEDFQIVAVCEQCACAEHRRIELRLY